MTSSDLKYNYEQENPNGHFFERKTLRFFGDTMKNYGVRAVRIRTTDGTPCNVWELYRRHPVKHGLKTSAYFLRNSYKQVWSEICGPDLNA